MALTKPFAEQGEKKAISLTPDAEGTMNYQDGFGQRYSLPVKSTISEDGTITTTGGLWIQREQFNQLMFDATSAIIENQDNITQLNQDLGNKGDLTTTNKDNIVSAINEIDSNIGDLQDLTTTEKSNVVSAINEIDSNYVRLDTEQTIPSVKTFSNVVNFGSIVNVNGEANFNDNVEMVNTPTITSPKTFQDLIDNELITKAQSVSKFVDFDTNQSVSGLKTFATLPQSEATPTDDKDLTTKLYVDTTLKDKIAEIGKAMGFKGIVENATDLPTDTATDGDMYYNKATSGETEDNKKGFYVFNGTAFDFIGATISMDFDKIFEIEEKQGDLTQLKTTAKDSLVNAINENYDNIATNSNNIGTLGNLTTTAKDSLVNAINENKANIDTNKSQVDSSLGDLTQLKTTAKDSLVNAINENYDSIETNSQHIADNEGAISTINENIGDLQNLTTTAKDNLVDSINEIDSNLKNNNFVTLDTNQTITSLKTFDTLPQSSVTPANDSDLVNKSYVDTQIADIDTTNLAKLDSNNQFTGENTFDIIPKSNGTPANDTDLATKAYVDNIQVDTSNLAKLNETNTFTQRQTFSNEPILTTAQADINRLDAKQLISKSAFTTNAALRGAENSYTKTQYFNGGVSVATGTGVNTLNIRGGTSGEYKLYSEYHPIEIESTQGISISGHNSLTLDSNPSVTTPKEWATMGDNEIPTKKQIQDNIQGGGGGGSGGVTLDTEQTIPSVKTFSNVVNFGSIVNVNGEANFNDNVEMVNAPTITSPKTFQDLIDNELITKAQSVSKFVDFDTNQSVSGLKTFTTLPQSEATPTNDNQLANKAYVDSVNATTPKLLNTNLTWTVGTGGNYTKLADALMEACKYQNIPNIGITITLKAGYDLASESITVNNVDLRFVTINCQSKLVCRNTRGWLNIVNSIAPTINLNVDASLNSYYILSFNCSNGIITMDGDYNFGIYAIRNSHIQINGGTINCVNGNGIVIRAGQVANISINTLVIIKGAKNAGEVISLYAGGKAIKNGGGNVNIQLSGTAKFLEAEAFGIFYGFNGTINSTSTEPVYCVYNGSYGYNYSTITGTAPQANIPFNTITSFGIILD